MSPWEKPHFFPGHLTMASTPGAPANPILCGSEGGWHAEITLGEKR